MNERTNLGISRKFFAFLGAAALKLVSYFGQGNDVIGFKKLMMVFNFINCVAYYYYVIYKLDTNYATI